LAQLQSDCASGGVLNDDEENFNENFLIAQSVTSDFFMLKKSKQKIKL